jgi:YHS domain-containing protein
MSFLFRIIELLIAFSLIRSVLSFVLRLWRGFVSGASSIRPPANQVHRAQGGDTLLQQDPVCGTYVSVETSLKKLTGGRVYHFCSAECRNRFTA